MKNTEAAAEARKEAAEKVAANRFTQEVVRDLAKLRPGLLSHLSDTHSLRAPTLTRALEFAGELSPSENSLTRQLLRRLPRSRSGEILHDANALAGRGLVEDLWRKNRKLKTPLHVEDFNKDLQLRASGHHAPRPGETFLPSMGGAERVFDPKRPEGAYIFRGNEIPKSDQFSFFSRHPDVAAGYASGDVYATKAPQNKMFAYARKDLPAHIEQPADQVPIGAVLNLAEHRQALNEALPHLGKDLPPTRHARVQEFRQNSSEQHPNYETLVPNAHSINPVGTYRVRPSRGPGGQPGYALSNESGLPLSEALGMPKSAHAVKTVLAHYGLLR